LREHFAPYPEKILAMEMGGNNPLVVTSVADKKTAAYITLISAYLTSGQRCSCARRLILTEEAEGFLPILQEMIKGIKIGAYTDLPEPFMGPLISKKAAEKVLMDQEERINHGGIPLLKMEQLHPNSSFLSPGLMDVTPLKDQIDEEIFGPFLQVIKVSDLDAAIQEANNTQYGLTAGLLSDNPQEYDEFYRRIKAGIINWNTPLTGASSAAPFGGIKKSGNHRPSAYYAADYCSYPVASIENNHVKMPATPLTGLTL
jgi:succinylglutamic semialdehyde dehydrogenase